MFIARYRSLGQNCPKADATIIQMKADATIKISFQCNLELDELDFALMSAILVTSEKKRNRFTRTIKESLKSQHVSLNR